MFLKVSQLTAEELTLHFFDYKGPVWASDCTSFWSVTALESAECCIKTFAL